MEVTRPDATTPFTSPALWRSNIRDWAIPALPIAFAIALYLVASQFPSMVERVYARGLYPYIGRALGSIAGLLPFSAGELILVCLVALAPALIYRKVRLFIRERGQRRALLVRAVRHGICALGIFAILFQVVWGLNYWRPPLAETLSFDRGQPTTVELDQISRQIIDGINKSYHLVHDASPQSVGDAFADHGSLEKAVADAYARDQLLPPATAYSGYAPPKPVLLHDLMARFGVSGVYSPFTGEPNYLQTEPGFDLPATMAHEMAHARGFAREDEADFVAFLICARSSDPRLQYSGYLSGLRVLSQLAALDVQRYKEDVKLIEDGPRHDLREAYEFWARYRGKASSFGTRINDLYLKVNGVKSGVKNYDEVSALIVGYFRKFKGDSQSNEMLAGNPVLLSN